MAAGSILDDRVFAEVKRLCCGDLDEMGLVCEVIERLRRAVPVDAYCAVAIDPLSGLPTRARAEEMGGIEEANRYFGWVNFQDDVNKYDWMARSRRPVALLSETTGGKLELSVRYREMIAPRGLGEELRGVFTTGDGLWGGIEVFRSRGSSGFTPREVALLRRITPHLGAGLKAAALRARTPLESGGNSDSPGMLVLDARGRVSHHTESAERLLRDLGDLEPGWREGLGLPAAVLAVAGALKRSLRPENDRDLESVPRLCLRSKSGRWMTLQAALSEPRSNGGGETMILIQPAGLREMAWLNAAAYGLSPREREVAELVARGASTRRISRTLFISEHTVQRHLSNTFEKVGVRSRQELLKRLFLDNLYPKLFT
jgi:DNA-binding CsgD family transcriptional regulator